MFKVNFKIISMCLAFLFVLTPFLHLGSALAETQDTVTEELYTDEKSTENLKESSSSQKVENNNIQQSGNPTDPLLKIAAIYAAYNYIVTTFTKSVVNKAWSITKPHLQKAVKDLKRYQLAGPNERSGGRIIAIIDTKLSDKDKRIFGLDYDIIWEKGKGRTKVKVLHYHVYPKMKEHYFIWPTNPEWNPE